MTENYFSCPKIVATFCTTILCNLLMFYTNLNMMPAIFLCNYLTIIDCDQDFCRLAKHFFDYNNARPTRFRFAVSFLIAAYATLATAVLQLSSRLLCLLLNISRSRSFEQNVLNSFQKCWTRSILYVGDEIVDTTTAFISFCTIIWTLYIFLSFLTRSTQENVRPNQKSQKFAAEPCPCLHLGFCGMISQDSDHVADQQEKKMAAPAQYRDRKLAQLLTRDFANTPCSFDGMNAAFSDDIEQPCSTETKFSYLDLATAKKKDKVFEKVVNLTDFIEKNLLKAENNENSQPVKVPLSATKETVEPVADSFVGNDILQRPGDHCCPCPPNRQKEAAEKIYDQRYKLPTARATVETLVEKDPNGLQQSATCATEKIYPKRTRDLENIPTEEIKTIYEKRSSDNVNMQKVREQMMQKMQETENLQKKTMSWPFYGANFEGPHDKQQQQQLKEEKHSCATKQLPTGFTQEDTSTKDDPSKKND